MEPNNRTEPNQLRHEDKARLRIAAKSSGLVVFNQDEELRYTWIYNPHPYFKSDEVLGKTDEELLPEEDAAQLIEVKRKVLETGESVRTKVRTTIDGFPYYYDLSIEPHYGEDQQIVGILGSSVDVTYQTQIEDTLRRVNEELEQRVRDRTEELLQEIAERKQIETELAEMQRRLMDSVEAERTLLARELHDGPMQEIYASMYHLSILRKSTTDGEMREELGKVEDQLKKIISNLRSTARNLRPATIGEFGVEKSIREHIANSQLDQHGLGVHLDLMADQKTLPEQVRLALFRIYQTAITNVMRHAKASKVDIRFRFEEDFITLEIEDDGQGFVVPKRWLHAAREGHLGLLSAYERAQAIGGQLEVKSGPGEGTLVRVVIPQ